MTEPAATLIGLNLVVQDMDKALEFYRTLGAEIPEESIWRTESGTHHVEASMPNGIGLDFDSPELAQKYNVGWNPESGKCLIGFSVASREAVDERYAALTSAGHRGLQPPYDAFWGARYAIVEDPDGNQVGLMSPVDESRTAAPPSI